MGEAQVIPREHPIVPQTLNPTPFLDFSDKANQDPGGLTLQSLWVVRFRV